MTDQIRFVTVKVMFELRDENGLYDLEDKELAQEVADLLEDEFKGLATYNSSMILELRTLDQNPDE